MIPSFYNFSVSPTWAEIQAVQVAQPAQAQGFPNAEVRLVWIADAWGKPYICGGVIEKYFLVLKSQKKFQYYFSIILLNCAPGAAAAATRKPVMTCMRGRCGCGTLIPQFTISVTEYDTIPNFRGFRLKEIVLKKETYYILGLISKPATQSGSLKKEHGVRSCFWLKCDSQSFSTTACSRSRLTSLHLPSSESHLNPSNIF